MKKNPCAKTCPDRSGTCHATCKTYKEFYDERRAKNKKDNAEKMIDDFTSDSVTKNVREKHRKKRS